MRRRLSPAALRATTCPFTVRACLRAVCVRSFIHSRPCVHAYVNKIRVALVCVSPVWVAPFVLVWVAPCLLCGSRPLSFCGSLPLRAPSVWAPSVWVGPLWVPPLLCLILVTSSACGMARSTCARSHGWPRPHTRSRPSSIAEHGNRAGQWASCGTPRGAQWSATSRLSSVAEHGNRAGQWGSCGTPRGAQWSATCQRTRGARRHHSHGAGASHTARRNRPIAGRPRQYPYQHAEP